MADKIVEVVPMLDGTMELTYQRHDAGLPRCDRLRPETGEICVLMLYGHRAHDMPCIFRSSSVEASKPMIITNVRRHASWPDVARPRLYGRVDVPDP